MKRIKQVIVLVVLISTTLLLSNSTLNNNDLIEEFFDEPLPFSGHIAVNSVGNANYYNISDGNYYADPEFTIPANDNTGYLLELFQSETEIYIPEGNFLCRTKLSVKGQNVRITGSGNTKIIFDARHFSNYGSGAVSEGLMVNHSYKGIFDAATAQNIEIQNIKFEYKRSTANNPKTMLLFGNINSLIINNCEFYADLEGQKVTNLDLYAACKNVQVTNCKFVNTTKAQSGGCIWVRNLTSAKEDIPGNVTENVIIENCVFEKNSKDEVVAVFPCRGHVRDVVVRKCTINNYYDNNTMVLSVYPGDNDWYGSARRVTFSDNYIYSSNTTAFVFMLGAEDRVNELSDVNITGNTIVAESKTGKRKFIIYVSGKNVNNVTVEENNITAKNFVESIGIENATRVARNKIIGTLEYGIVNGEVVDNYISGARIGIKSSIARNNEIENCQIGISTNPDSAVIENNKITLSSAGKAGVEVLSNKKAQKSNVEITNNTISTENNKQYGFYISSGRIYLKNNNVLGNAKMVYKRNDAIVIEE